MDDKSTHVSSREYAVSLDAQDPLPSIRDQFLIPTKASLRAESLSEAGKSTLSPIATKSILPPFLALCKRLRRAFSAEFRNLTSSEDGHGSCIYLCGNSLGPQPKLVSKRIHEHLSKWSSLGVFGHFKPLSGTPLPTWVDADEKVAECMAPIVGALPSEVAVMQTLTANLHFLMSAFYKPDGSGRHKIILETKAFPSDHVGPFHYYFSIPVFVVYIFPDYRVASQTDHLGNICCFL